MSNRINTILLGMVDKPTRPEPPSSCDIAESYRIKLGLQPWDERSGRRSGKTTRLILRALAECVVDPDVTVLLGTDPPLVRWTSSYVDLLAHQLGVDRSRIEVGTHAAATRKATPQRGDERQRKMIELHDSP